MAQNDSEKVTYVCIATTQDTGDPVFRVMKDDSHMEVILDTEDKCINVWYVSSRKKGDMKAMLDHLVPQVGTNTLRFIYPMRDSDKKVVEHAIQKLSLGHTTRDMSDNEDKNIHDVLHGFDEVALEFDGQKVPCLVGEWEV